MASNTGKGVSPDLTTNVSGLMLPHTIPARCRSCTTLAALTAHVLCQGFGFPRRWLIRVQCTVCARRNIPFAESLVTGWFLLTGISNKSKTIGMIRRTEYLSCRLRHKKRVSSFDTCLCLQAALIEPGVPKGDQRHTYIVNGNKHWMFPMCLLRDRAQVGDKRT